jgi:hypothetical protein
MTELDHEEVSRMHCEESNEPSGFVNGIEYVGKFNNYLPLKLIILWLCFSTKSHHCCCSLNCW